MKVSGLNLPEDCWEKISYYEKNKENNKIGKTPNQRKQPRTKKKIITITEKNLPTQITKKTLSKYYTILWGLHLFKLMLGGTKVKIYPFSCTTSYIYSVHCCILCNVYFVSVGVRPKLGRAPPSQKCETCILVIIAIYYDSLGGVLTLVSKR